MRFAGSNLSFTDFTHSGAGGQGVGQAADLASLGDTFASYRQSAPSYGKVAQTNLAARGHEKRAALTAEANTVAQGMQAEASVKANKIAAEAAKAAARDQASGAMMGSALSAIGTIGGALIMSDERTKNTVERIEDALTVLRELKPVSFYYNEEYSSNPERLHYGFIAQDYQKVMPDATYYDESIGKLCIDTNELIGLLVRSVQQLETRLTRMEAKQALAGVK
jgi:hypothetical protein